MIKPDTFPKYAPILDYPPHLKDHRNFKKVQMAILNAGATRHSHSEIAKWAECKKCNEKMWARKEMMKGLGFKNARHYLNWVKIHRQIESLKRMPFPKYNSK